MRRASRRNILEIFLSTLLAGATSLHAGHEIEEEEKPEPPNPAWMLGDWGGLRTRLEDRGVYLSMDYTADVLGNPVGGKRQGAGYAAAVNLGIELELEYLIGWKGATIAATATYPHGAVYSERYLGDLNGATSLESYDTIRLLELWFEQKVVLGPAELSLRVGSQAIDAEFWQNPRENVLLNNSFGTPLTFSGNFPIPSYALAAVGARFAAVIGKPSERAALVQVGVFDGNPASGVLADPTPGSPPSTDYNKHGVQFALRDSEGILFAAETGYTFNQPAAHSEASEDEDDEGKEVKKVQPPSRGLAGNYRIGVIHHTDTFTNVADEAQLNQDVEIGRASARRVDGNSAIYAMIDQEIWRESGSDSEGLSLFGRAAFAPKQQNRYDYSWEAGLNYLGLIPGRPNDQLVLGFGLSHINSNVSSAVRAANRALSRRGQPAAAREVEQARRDVAAINRDPENYDERQNDLNEALDSLAEAQAGEREARREDELNRGKRLAVPDYEAVLELTYRAQVTPWLSLQPDVQWIIHPGGSAAIDDALVLGLRASVTF